MSRWTDPAAARRRIYRSLIVDEYTATDWDEYLREQKRGE
jgi:hypothetical protein